MSGHPIRKLLVLAAVAAAVAAVVRALRGDPAPQLSAHPTVSGGPTPPGSPTGGAVPKLQAMPSPDPNPATALQPDPDAPAREAADDEPVAEVLQADATWVAPLEGDCPDGYPIKAKLSSRIFHQPGGAAYERTSPDRCYADAAAAEADGFRAAKR